MTDDLRYPIGPFVPPATATEADRRSWIGEIGGLPRLLAQAVDGLDDVQLDTRYRPGGWTVRQVVHHVADSHVNSYARVRLALTETDPVIRPYDEARWAELADAREGPLALSLALLEALHARWTALLRSLAPADWNRTYIHPDHDRRFTLDEVAALYAWHGRHHVAHITSLRARAGWN